MAKAYPTVGWVCERTSYPFYIEPAAGWLVGSARYIPYLRGGMNMRKILIIILFAFLFVSCAEREDVMVTKALDISAQKLMESLMAVPDEGNIDTQKPISVIFVEGVDGRWGSEAMDKLEKHLIKTGKFKVVTPPSEEELKKLIDVVGPQIRYSDFFDQKLVIRLGKLIPPRLAIVGEIKWLKKTTTGVSLSLDAMMIDLEKGNRPWRDDAEANYKDLKIVLLRVAVFILICIVVFVAAIFLNELTARRFSAVIYGIAFVVLVVIFYFMLSE